VSRFPSVPVLFEDGKFKSEQERDEGCERLREGVREGEKERKIYSADAPTTTRVLGGAIKGGESHRGDKQKERKKERKIRINPAGGADAPAATKMARVRLKEGERESWSEEGEKERSAKALRAMRRRPRPQRGGCVTQRGRESRERGERKKERKKERKNERKEDPQRP
jgi:hypothetical protein